MATTTIRNTITDSAGVPQQGIPVRITLVTALGGRVPGVGASSSVTVSTQVVTDAAGLWSADLVPNSAIGQPAGSYYQVSEGGYNSLIVVPSGGGPYLLSQVLVSSPSVPLPTYVVSPATFTVDVAGVGVGTRPVVNLVAGAGVALVGVDNPGAARVDVTVTAAPLTLVFTTAGTLGTSVGTVRLYNDSGRAMTIGSVRASVGTAPTGQSVVVDVNLDGSSSIFALLADQPTIVAGVNTSGRVAPTAITSIADGHFVTMDVDQVGSGVAGANLTVSVLLT